MILNKRRKIFKNNFLSEKNILKNLSKTIKKIRGFMK